MDNSKSVIFNQSSILAPSFYEHTLKLIGNPNLDYLVIRCLKLRVFYPKLSFLFSSFEKTNSRENHHWVHDSNLNLSFCWLKVYLGHNKGSAKQNSIEHLQVIFRFWNLNLNVRNIRSK